ncbi:MAG: RNA recognition motif domain-containing protein [Syntrophobacteraceae bacterium]
MVEEQGPQLHKLQIALVETAFFRKGPSMNIFVGSLSYNTTEEELQKEFEAFGEVRSVKIILDQVTLKSRGIAFITMPNQDQATAAIAGLNGKELNGFSLKVNEARPREARGGPPRQSGGTGYPSTNRTVFGSSSRPGSGSGGGGRGRPGNASNNLDLDIYDTKGGRSGGGHGKKGRGGSGRGSGGRSGGGKRSY